MSKSSKPPLMAAADALAFQSRRLRAAAVQPAEPDAPDVITRLEGIGAAQRADEDRERAARANAVVASVAPLVERARTLVAENRRLRGEHGALIGRLSALDWPAILKRATVRVVAGSPDTVVTRLGFLKRTVEELEPMLREDADAELRAVLDRVQSFNGSETDAAATTGRLKQLVEYGGAAGFTRPRIVVIRRLLGEIAGDLDAVDAANLNDAATQA